MNHVVLIGRLTRDPELRYTPNGVAVTTFTLAVNRPFTNQAGEQEADFIQVVAWQKLAENCANYLGKGRLCAVEGRLQIRNYEDKDGQKRKVAEVIASSVQFLDRANTSDNKGTAPQNQAPNDVGNINLDDLPF